MAPNAEREWQILRVLHENWEVPIILLVELSNESVVDFNNRVQLEKWQPKNSVIGLQKRLSQIVDRQLLLLSEDQTEQLDLEKTNRTIAAVAKTMESLANVALKLDAMEERTLGQLKSEIDDVKHQSSTDDTLALDHKIEALVDGLETDRKPVRGHENMAG